MIQIDITSKGMDTVNHLKKDVPHFRDVALKNISDENKKAIQATLNLIINNCI